MVFYCDHMICLSFLNNVLKKKFARPQGEAGKFYVIIWSLSYIYLS